MKVILSVWLTLPFLIAVECSCFSKALDRTFPVGESWHEEGCSRAECVADWQDGLPGVLLLGCQYIVEDSIGENCSIVEADPQADWPACCKTVYCENEPESEEDICGDSCRIEHLADEASEGDEIVEKIEAIPIPQNPPIPDQSPVSDAISFDNSSESTNALCSDGKCESDIKVVDDEHVHDAEVVSSSNTNGFISRVLNSIAKGMLFGISLENGTNSLEDYFTTCKNGSCSDISKDDAGHGISEDQDDGSHLKLNPKIGEQLLDDGDGIEVIRFDDDDDEVPSDLSVSASASVLNTNPILKKKGDDRRAPISIFQVPTSTLNQPKNVRSKQNENKVNSSVEVIAGSSASQFAILLPLSEDSNPCLQDNGGCSHQCSVDVSQRVICRCPAHMSLSSDEKECEADGDRARLLFSSRQQLHLAEMDGGEGEAQVVVSGLSNAVGVDYDWRRRCLYWTVVQTTGSVHRMCQGEQPTELWSDGLRPDNLAVDWITGNLYWTDGGLSTISVSDRHGLLRKTLVSAGVEKPRAIVLYQEEGRLYYTDWGSQAVIGQVSMDGSGHWLIVTSGLVWPNALTLSRPTRQLFWADGRMGHVESADLDGTNRRVLLRSPTAQLVGALQHIFSMDVYGGRLFWSSWETSSVVSYNGSHAITVANSSSLPMTVRVFHPDQQPLLKGGNPCAPLNGTNPCSGLCLLSSNGSATCVCPDKLVPSTSIEDVASESCVSRCEPSRFQCRSVPRCISRWLVCNNQDDCGDGSDEPNICPAFNCSKGQVQCRTGQCISATQLCDGEQNCLDGADELSCDVV